jgi:hypothetical protein
LRARLTHAFTDRAKAAKGRSRLGSLLRALRGPLARRAHERGESLERWPEVHERYAAEFGVDPELGRRAIAEHKG